MAVFSKKRSKMSIRQGHLRLANCGNHPALPVRVHSAALVRFIADFVIDIVERIEFANDLPCYGRLSFRERIFFQPVDFIASEAADPVYTIAGVHGRGLPQLFAVHRAEEGDFDDNASFGDLADKVLEPLEVCLASLPGFS
jgi:hypothetical protein